jgi:hypothetical protein
VHLIAFGHEDDISFLLSFPFGVKDPLEPSKTGGLRKGPTILASIKRVLFGVVGSIALAANNQPYDDGMQCATVVVVVWWRSRAVDYWWYFPL